MNNQNQENERSRQAEGNTSREKGQNDTQNPGNVENFAQADKTENQSGQQETENSNENSASGANKGPAGSYNEKDANIGNRRHDQGLED